MTAKQTLFAHIRECHRAGRGRVDRMTLVELQAWHANQHHRYFTNHHHAGVNLGPGDRPAGWRTGEDAVPNVAP